MCLRFSAEGCRACRVVLICDGVMAFVIYNQLIMYNFTTKPKLSVDFLNYKANMLGSDLSQDIS
jgi:hypothetical protein